MVLLEPTNTEKDAHDLWNMVNELTEQLTRNRAMLATLHGQASGVKTQAIHCQNGFVLRRFNMDKSQEAYDAELENMTNAMREENRELMHDNKQLQAMIKEYEQTLESLMSTFRNRAQAVQERELSLIKEFEKQLLASEEAAGELELTAAASLSSSISRLSYALRQLLRMQNGEDPEPLPSTTFDPDEFHDIEEREPWLSPSRTRSDHALERDCELARLQSENEWLKRMVSLMIQSSAKPEILDVPPRVPTRQHIKDVLPETTTAS